MMTRQEFVRRAAGAGVAMSLGSPLLAACGGNGEGGEASGGRLTALTWGNPYIDMYKDIASDWEAETGNRITWQLHEGAASTSLSKIAAAWPRVIWDITAQWSGTYPPMIREGWLATVTPDNVPNLADIPEALIPTDGDGNWKAVPLSLSGATWAYRSDVLEDEIDSLDDLLDPAFRGKVVLPAAPMNSGTAIVALALHAGGDERNIDAGFEFGRKLAKAGSIGRIISSDQEFITSMTTGETVIGHQHFGAWQAVAEHFPIKPINRSTRDRGLGSMLWTEGWTITEGSKNKEAAFSLANAFITPENNTKYGEAVGLGTTNPKASQVEAFKRFSYEPDELERFVHPVDFDFLSSKLDEWNRRWEREVISQI